MENRIFYFDDKVVLAEGLPEKFTFPFYYEPHPLARHAAASLQQYLNMYPTPGHNFGLEGDAREGAIGKMFGVLVVRDREGHIGHLWAFSGKLAGTNDHERFVPPVFDMLTHDSYFLQEQEQISLINSQLEALLADPQHKRLQQEMDELSARADAEIATLKATLRENKAIRKARREAATGQPTEALQALEAELVQQSLYDKRLLRDLTERFEAMLLDAGNNVSTFNQQVETLRTQRKERSAALQERLFSEYTFLNKAGISKSLADIFSATAFGRPPSAAGECATPKLLQYAFANGYEPLAMAEFWWGASPVSEVRKHGHFYPACTGKCKPILEHMLHGTPTDENPFLIPTDARLALQTVYEDEYLIVVNKPAGLRSVPGVSIYDSVYSRLQATHGDAVPHMVHRLDMGTSGLLVVAKNANVHKHLQRQFLNRRVTKRYTALLSRPLSEENGRIELPLRPDPFNRPLQQVCFREGKRSITQWRVVNIAGNTTRIHFWPLTGRTHQLRMHAAHQQGLNAPIIGDDLYGTAAERLYLHAAYLSFQHPHTKQQVSFEAAEDF